ncbi:hypothetical protein OIU84_025485 [Salix udensis]|uniref:Uncharacterized protein n=1 Tax=Salix udensis TaxID=889485 RepID=A0AAD6KJM9_9ROSI|nr:hypothetical protein OIU84_025485 [Salix udensis]
MTKDDSKRFENSLLKNQDTKLGGHLSEASSEEDFTGKPGQSMVLRVPAPEMNQNLILLQRLLLGLCWGHMKITNKKLKYAEDVSSAVIFEKELLNSPANVLTPAVLAEEATKIASTYNDVFSSTILNAKQCKELKMGSYLGVAAASENPPHFIHLCYKPPSGPNKAMLSSVFTEA